MRLVKYMVLVLILAGGCGKPDEPERNVAEVKSFGAVGCDPGRFLKPRAIAASGERLFVADMSGRIQCFDLDGRWRSSWTLSETSHGFPSGLAFLASAPPGPERIAVADTHNHRVLFYSAKGELLGSLGKEGGGPGELTYATDAKADRAGNLFVSDHGREDRILKFDASGKFVSSWGRTGDQPGEFHRPQALAVDDEGSVYVADAANHRVQKFSPQGEFIASFGAPGRGPGEMLYPYGLALTENHVLAVCEYGNNRVQLFDAQGRSVGILGKAGPGPGELASPRGIAYVRGRGIYVCDMDNHRVQLFPLPGKAGTRRNR